MLSILSSLVGAAVAMVYSVHGLAAAAVRVVIEKPHKQLLLAHTWSRLVAAVQATQTALTPYLTQPHRQVVVEARITAIKMAALVGLAAAAWSLVRVTRLQQARLRAITVERMALVLVVVAAAQEVLVVRVAEVMAAQVGAAQHRRSLVLQLQGLAAEAVAALHLVELAVLVAAVLVAVTAWQEQQTLAAVVVVHTPVAAAQVVRVL